MSPACRLAAPEEQTLKPLIRKRLLTLINPALPVIFIEGGVGMHKAALLEAWAKAPAEQIRVLFEFDPNQHGPQLLTNRLAYQLAIAGVISADPPDEDDSWEGLSKLLVAAVERLDQPLALGVIRLDELPSQASAALLRAAGSLPHLSVVGTAVDAFALQAQAAQAGVGYRIIGDQELAYSKLETAGLLADQLPEADDNTVRAVLEATRGIPALVERVVQVFPQECLAGTLRDHQALSGWQPHRQGREEFWRQMHEVTQAPRFHLELLVELYGRERAEYLFGRLSKMGYGTILASGGRGSVFTWFPVIRQYLLSQRDPALPEGQLAKDRAAIAQAAAATEDPELALAMLVANQSLAAAESLSNEWLWELQEIDADLLWTHFTAINPQELAQYPGLLTIATFIQPGHGESAVDPELANIQRQLLTGSITGTVPDQLSQLAKAALLALGLGELGIAIRAALRWANLITSKPEEWLPALSPGMVSDGLLMIRALIQLDRVDLVPGCARAFLWPMRRHSELVGDASEQRLGSLLTAFRCATIHLGTSRSEIKSVEIIPRQYSRELDVALNATIDSIEAIDRGDLSSAEAFTRVALHRLPHPADWPMLIYARAVALVGLGDRENLENLDDEVLASARWETWQHHPEAPGFYAMLTEILVQASIQRGRRSLAELLTSVKAYPPGAQHRWAPWSRRVLELWASVAAGASRGPVVPTDAELESRAPRIGWQLGAIAALNNLRAGEGATATSVLLRGGAALRYPASPTPLVFATRDEVNALVEGLPPKTSAIVRNSLALAGSFAGVSAGPRNEIPLAARELEVLDGVRRGLTNTALASELFVSVNTIKFHRANLYRKLAAKSREQLLAQALKHGL